MKIHIMFVAEFLFLEIQTKHPPNGRKEQSYFSLSYKKGSRLLLLSLSLSLSLSVKILSDLIIYKFDNRIRWSPITPQSRQ